MKRSSKDAPASKTAGGADDLLEDQIGQAQAARAAAERDLARLREKRPTLLLDLSPEGDARLDALDIEASRAARAVERADAVLKKLGEELATRREAEKQERRRSLFDEGLAAAKEYRRLAESEYAASARAIADVMAKMDELAAVCERANCDRPAGAAAIDPDAFAREKVKGRPMPPLTMCVYLPSVRPSDPDFWNQGAS